MKPFYFALMCGLLAAAPLRADDKTGANHTPKQVSLESKAESDLHDWDQKLDSLRQRSEQAGRSTRQDLDVAIKTLSDDIAGARNELTGLKSSNTSQWDDVHKKLNHTLADIRKAYQKAADYFKPRKSQGGNS